MWTDQTCAVRGWEGLGQSFPGFWKRVWKQQSGLGSHLFQWQNWLPNLPGPGPNEKADPLFRNETLQGGSRRTLHHVWPLEAGHTLCAHEAATMSAYAL